jgi:hypothetical protein
LENKFKENQATNNIEGMKGPVGEFLSELGDDIFP